MRWKAVALAAALMLSCAAASAQTPDAGPQPPVAAPQPPVAGPQPPSARFPDGIPAGVQIPAEAAGQAFEFGNCDMRAHSTGGWVCTEDPELTATASKATRRKADRRKRGRPVARAAAYYRYHFTQPATVYWDRYRHVRVDPVGAGRQLQRRAASDLAGRHRVKRRAHGPLRLQPRSVAAHVGRLAVPRLGSRHRAQRARMHA